MPALRDPRSGQLVDTDGNVLGKLDWKLSIKPDPDRPVVARCKHCEQTWPIFADQDGGATGPEPTVEIVETEQTAERFRVDTMCLDNRGGTSPLRRSVTKSQEWSRSYEISDEESKTSEKNLSIPLTGGTLGLKAERAVKSSYSVTEDKKAVLTDTFDFEVPPNTLREVSFIYKRIWQHGLVRVEEAGEIRRRRTASPFGLRSIWRRTTEPTETIRSLWRSRTQGEAGPAETRPAFGR